MFTIKKIDNQIYVWYKGQLIYKKWLSTGKSVVFGLHGEVFHG